MYEDTESASNARKVRKGYQAMLRRIEAGELDTIVCVDQDRLLRQPIELERLIELADAVGLWVVTVSGDIDLTTDDGQFRARIEAAVARKEVVRKGTRQRRSERQAVEQGRPPRRRAFGYAKGGMALVEQEAAGVRDAYRMVLAGSSLSSVAAHLNAAGLRTTLGREWEPTAVRALLLNARNAAIRTYYGEEAGPGTWPAIVPEGIYRQAAALLTAPDRMTSGGRTARKWLGASLYVCGKCEAEGVEATVRTAYRDAGTRIYVCTRSRHLTRLAEPIDAAVLAAVVARLGRSDVADLLAAEAPELTGLTDRAAVIRALIKRVEDDYGDGQISARQMREQIARHQVELDGIKARTATLTRQSRLSAVVGTPDPAGAFLGLDLGARREVLAALVKVVLLPGRPGRAAFDPDTIRLLWR